MNIQKHNQNTKDESFNPPNNSPWRVTHHANGLIKVESKDRVIFDGFQGEETYAYLAASAPALKAALMDCMRVMQDMGLHDEVPDSAGIAMAQSRPPVLVS
jgi:hypothetical protein